MYRRQDVRIGRPWLVGGDDNHAQIPCLVVKDGGDVKQELEYKGVVATTNPGRETSEPISFLKGLPQGDALCPRLFTVCLNPIAWKVSDSEGFKLSISQSVQR